MSKLFKFIFTSCFLLTAYCSLLTAQTSTATLTGTIQDQNGAVVPGVTVTVVNDGTSNTRTSITNDDGSFTVSLLPPGRYTVTARRDGFAAIQVQDVVLNVADNKSLSMQLKVGDASAPTVDVTADAFLVNTGTSVATTIDRAFVANLPLNGRSFSSLVLLTPGVTVTPVGGALGELGQFSVNGQRASTNAFTVDGVSANIGVETSSTQSMSLAGSYPGTSAFGGTNNLVSQDALEEFTLQTSGYSAESGRQPGGQIQIVTRSGGNKFHGALFELLRNEAFDARNYFNKKPAPEPPLRQNQFGGTFSGPIIVPNIGDGGKPWYIGKNRTFFFFSYEGQRLLLPASGVQRVPSLRVRQIAAASLQPLLNAFPLPTGPEDETTTTCNPNIGNPRCSPTGFVYSGRSPYNYSLSNPSNLDATSIRIDHAITPKNNLFARFNEAPSNSTDGIIGKAKTISNSRTFTAGLNSFFRAGLSNEFRFNYSRQQSSSRSFVEPMSGGTTFDENLLTNGYSSLAFLSINPISSGAVGGGAVTYLVGSFSDNFQRQLNIVDNVSVGTGSHYLKFGVDFRRLSPIFAPHDSDNYTFSNEAAITAGMVNTYRITSRMSARPQYDSLSVFAQDNWRVSRRLTLDLGLRWEFNPPPSEANDQYPRVVTGVEGTDVTSAIIAPEGTPFYKTFYTAFAPRFGAAYLLVDKAGIQTVVRGAFGLYYDMGSGGAARGWPFTATKTLSGIAFPISVVNASRPPVVASTSNAQSSDEALRLPYTLQWNLTLEQSIGKGHTVMAAYVASAARQLLTLRTLNEQPRDPLTGALLPRPNPNFGSILHIANGPTADYHSLQLQYRTRLGKALQGIVNYTWAHAIDEVSSDVQQGVFERGNASFDVRHNLSAALHYDIPTLSDRGILKYLFRGWTVDGIVHAQSGFPLNIGIAGSLIINDLSVSARPDLILGQPLYIQDSSVPGGRRFNSDAFRSPAECLPAGAPNCVNTIVRQGTFGRNVLRGLPIYQLDLALGKQVRLAEQLGLQLKVEAFNVFNHPMFSAYGGNFTIRDEFGVPTNTLNRGLGGFSALYQLGGSRSIQLSARLSF